MYEAKIENKNGQVLVLTGKEQTYQVLNIQGLNPPHAQINTTSIVGLDGARYNSARMETRNIVLTVKVNGDVEENRLNLYSFFRTKEWCRFYYSNSSRNVYIEGYVESVECDLFTNSETAQISIICPYPYFRAVKEIIVDISNVLGLFVFPFSINAGEPIPFSAYETNRETNVFNPSESEVGVIVKMTFEDSANSVAIRNTDTGDTLTLNYSFVSGDVVTINTRKGQKSIYLLRNGSTTNIFPALEMGSVFFQLGAGANHFAYLVDGGDSNGDVFVEFSFSAEFRGV